MAPSGTGALNAATGSSKALTEPAATVKAQATGSATPALEGAQAQAVSAATAPIQPVTNAAALAVSPPLTTGTVARDVQAFVGADGQRGRNIVARLAGGDTGLQQQTRLRSGVEVRSTATLTLAGDWNLLAGSSSSGVATPITLTLRATGDLLLANSLSDGFGGSAIAANGLAQAGPAASYRLVGGADPGAADPLATVAAVAAVAAGKAGDVVIGRAPTRTGATPPGVFIRTSTGRIDIAAGQDIRLLNSQARIYTTGAPVATADTPGLATRYSFPASQLLAPLASGVSPFFSGAGDITLQAGRDIIGTPSTTYNSAGNVVATQYVTDWWWRQTAPPTAAAPQAPVALWSRYDLFGQSLASFGGGDVRVSAGRDVRDLEASTPTSGYSIGASAAQPAQQRWFKGGTLDVSAGRDVVSGLFNAGGPLAALAASGAIVPAASTGIGQSAPVTQLFYLDTDWSVQASRSIALGPPTNPAYYAGTSQGFIGLRTDLVTGLDTDASLRVASAAGRLLLSTTRPTLSASDSRTSSSGLEGGIAPSRLALLAPAGAITANSVIQRPVGATSLTILADGDVAIGGLQLASAAVAAPPAARARGRPTLAAFDESTREPVRVASAHGSLLISGAVNTARSLRLLADGDITVGGEIVIAHQDRLRAADGSLQPAPAELSLLQAGEDIVMNYAVSTGLGSIRLGGPGDLLLAAGRDIDFGRGPGIVTVGNQDNPRVQPSGGANITLLAGIDLRSADYRSAPADAAVSTSPALPAERRALLRNELLFTELRAAGRAASQLAGEEREAAYATGYDALAALFPASKATGSVNLSNSLVKTQQGGDIRILAPRGGVNVGELGSATTNKKASELGIITVAGGRIESAVNDNFDVNQSRVFTLQKGDLLLWSSQGNLDAGRGAKTVTGSPPPLFTIDDKGNVVVDTTGSFSGSGIAVLDPGSSLDLYAPKGEINAGDAGIKSAGNAFFGAVRFVGADNLAVGGVAVGAPPPAPTGGVTAGLANVGQAAANAASRTDNTNDDEEERRKRRARRNLLLEFLGFGSDKP